jgi:hypothetical protein
MKVAVRFAGHHPVPLAIYAAMRAMKGNVDLVQRYIGGFR